MSLARSSSIVRDCVVGRGTTIGDRTTVEACVLGPNCRIGAGVTLVGCYLWGNVVVGDGASLNGCICCDDVVVGAGAMVAPGCVLGKGVKVGSGCGLPRYARLWAPDAASVERAEEEEADDEDDEDDGEEGEAGDVGGVQPSGEGGPWSGGVYSESAARRATAAATAAALGKGGSLLGDDGVGTLYKVVPTAVSIGVERPRELDGPVEGEDSEEEEEEMQAMEDHDADQSAAFASEVGAMVRRAVAAEHSIDTVFLEINSLKLSQHRPFDECVRAIVPALLEMPSLQTTLKKERIAALKKAVKRWFLPLLSKFVQGKEDRLAVVEALCDACAPHEPLLEIFEHVLNQLYEGDLLPQEAILGWADTAGESDEGSDERKCLAKANNMITWLREDDDDDDDDEEDD